MGKNLNSNYKPPASVRKDQYVDSDKKVKQSTSSGELLFWISVRDRLPEKGERVLVTNGGFVCEAYLNLTGKWMRSGFELIFMQPTYWMPLPEPPEERKDGEENAAD